MKIKSLISIVMATCLLSNGTALAKTNRKATVTVFNHTGGPIIAGFSHIYSNVYKDHGVTKSDKPLGTTPLDLMQNIGKARFRTGFGTTGKDWWVVTYVNDLGCEYISSPRNARKFVDGLEKVALYTGGPLTEIGIDIAIAGLLDPEPVGKIAGGVVGLVTAGVGAAMVGLSNTESTAGMKQHILKAKDKKIGIFIFKDKVMFSSKSGKSTTRMVHTGKCIVKVK